MHIHSVSLSIDLLYVAQSQFSPLTLALGFKCTRRLQIPLNDEGTYELGHHFMQISLTDVFTVTLIVDVGFLPSFWGFFVASLLFLFALRIGISGLNSKFGTPYPTAGTKQGFGPILRGSVIIWDAALIFSPADRIIVSVITIYDPILWFKLWYPSQPTWSGRNISVN